MKYTKYPELKAELKELAKEIKELKYKRDHWWKFGNDQSEFMWKACRAAWLFRHRHIAYCLLRGRSYEEIEQPGRYNKPSWSVIEGIMEKYEQKAELRAV